VIDDVMVALMGAIYHHLSLHNEQNATTTYMERNCKDFGFFELIFVMLYSEGIGLILQNHLQ
jgi:hypothetical protein